MQLNRKQIRTRGLYWPAKRQAIKTKIMKTQIIAAKSASAARKQAPWAAKVVKVEGGYMAFESVADYAQWRRQK